MSPKKSRIKVKRDIKQSHKMKWLLFIATALFGVTHNANASTGLKILDEQSVWLPDYSYAGYKYGVEAIPRLKGEVVKVDDFGAKADDGLDDSQAILKALEKAHTVSGPVVVQFSTGKYIVSELLRIKRSEIVLRGAGAGKGGTTLFFPRPLKIVDKGESLKELTEYLLKYDKRQREPQNNIDELFSEYSWSGGFILVQKEGTRPAPYMEKNDPPIQTKANALLGKAGEFNVTVSDDSSLKKGDVVELLWFNRDGENGALVNEIYGKTDLKIGSHHWTKPDRPLVRQKTTIQSIKGNQVTIADPLLHNISADLPAQFAHWDHLTEVGIEELHIEFPNAPRFAHHLEQGYNGIFFTSVFNGWVRNLTITNADSGILTYNSANLTISDIHTNGDRIAHYGVHAGNVHNVLMKNLIINNPVVHSLSFNTQSTRSVCTNVHIFRTPVFDQHAGANHQNLFDNVHMYFSAQRDDDGNAVYPVWDGSGAGYWQPGHGRYNTTWNLKVTVLGGAMPDEKVILQGLAEGPAARVVGVSGNREFEIDYRPEPYMEAINQVMREVPSLYEWQLKKRLSQ